MKALLLLSSLTSFSIVLLCINLPLCSSFDDHAHNTQPLASFPQTRSHGDLDCHKAFAGKGGPAYGGKVHTGLVHPLGPCSPVKKLAHLSADMPNLALEILKMDQERCKYITTMRSPLPRKITRSLATSTASWASGVTASGQLLGVGNFIMKVGVGTPMREFLLILDTGSDLTWTQCIPCDSPTSCYQQANPLFDPTTSTSYSTMSCSTTNCALCSSTGFCQYNMSYVDGSITSGDLAEETIYIGSATIQNYIFGCGRTSQGTFTGVDGLLGLGWGAIAMPTQTLLFFGGAFAYCLPSILSLNAVGFIEFGVEAVVNVSASSLFTPMIQNANMPSYYFVWLKAISVGGVPLPLASTPSIPPTSLDLSGTLVDSGTVISRLPALDYVTFRNAFIAGSISITLLSPTPDSVFDTCFQFTNESQVPTVTLHFDGFDFPLAIENIFFPLDLSTNSVCLAFAPTPSISTSSQQLLIIGNHQMQGSLFTFDILGSKMGIQTSSKVC